MLIIESGISDDNQDSVTKITEGLFIATTADSSSTLFAMWPALVTKRDGTAQLSR
jgi:hypothetical protein